MFSLRIIVLLPLAFCSAFQVPTGGRHTVSIARKISPLLASVESETAAAESNTAVVPRALRADGLHAEDRYVSTLRYLVPKGEQVAFEHRWKTRAEQLATEPGLKYFQVTKRAADFMGPPLPEDEFNYQSFCVWESKEAYEGCAGVPVDAGHGAPANYDGLFALSLPPSVSGVPSGECGTVDAGKRLPREAFVASNRFGIKPGFEKDFEDMWAARDTSLADLPGFVNFQLLRREGSADDDGNTYVSYTTWDSAQAFNNWRGSENFKKSHSNRGGDKESPYSKMPKVVTFKTFLVTSAEGGM